MINKYTVRNDERKSFTVEAELVSGGERYPGFIQNASESGLNIVSYPERNIISFLPRERLELKFQSSGKKINVEGEVVWVHITKNLSQGLIYTIAMEIMSSSPDYREFLQTTA